VFDYIVTERIQYIFADNNKKAGFWSEI